MAPVNDLPFFDVASKKKVQEVLDTLLFYARAVDCTMLPAINAIAAQQANSTEKTMLKVTKLLNYCVTHPNAVVCYKASNMIPWCNSDASYLTAPKARSQGAGCLYLSNKPQKSHTKSGNSMPMMNSAVHVMCMTMRKVMWSATEAELDSLFHNGKEFYPL